MSLASTASFPKIVSASVTPSLAKLCSDSSISVEASSVSANRVKLSYSADTRATQLCTFSSDLLVAVVSILAISFNKRAELGQALLLADSERSVRRRFLSIASFEILYRIADTLVAIACEVLAADSARTEGLRCSRLASRNGSEPIVDAIGAASRAPAGGSNNASEFPEPIR